MVLCTLALQMKKARVPVRTSTESCKELQSASHRVISTMCHSILGCCADVAPGRIILRRRRRRRIPSIDGSQRLEGLSQQPASGRLGFRTLLLQGLDASEQGDMDLLLANAVSQCNVDYVQDGPSQSERSATPSGPLLKSSPKHATCKQLYGPPPDEPHQPHPAEIFKPVAKGM